MLIFLCFETTLFQAKLPMSEIAATINEFRTRHLSELTEVSSFSFAFIVLACMSGCAGTCVCMWMWACMGVCEHVRM